MKLRRRKIGEILIDNGTLNKERLNAALEIQNRKIGKVLIDNGTLSDEQIDEALRIQKKETLRLLRKQVILLSIFILPALFAYNNFNRPRDIAIQEAKIVTGVDKQLMPLKATNFFPKNTSKVSAWISWRDAKVNTQVLVKWYYLTDDTPIYNYSLNIPKREGVANVVLSMPEGKTLPSGSYKVTIFFGKKQLTKPLTFEIE